MNNSNYVTSNETLMNSKISQNISYTLLVISINLYSLLVPIRIFTSNSLYTAIEMILLISMTSMIAINFLRNPYFIIKYGVEISIFYVIVIISLLGTLLLRMNVEINQTIRYLRNLFTPFIFSLLILTSEFNGTKLFKKGKHIFIPILSLILATLSSIIQLVNPTIIREFMFRNELYHEMSRSTNFLRGSIHNRLIGIFNDPNLFGAFLVLNIILIVLHFESKGDFKKSIKYIIPLLIFLILTTSRSAIITFIACGFVFLISKINFLKIRPRNFGKNTIVFFIFLGLFVAGLAWVFSALNLSFETLLNTRFQWKGYNEFRNFNNRSTSWLHYLDLFSSSFLNILFGIKGDNMLESFRAIENTYIGFNLKYGMIIFSLTILYLVRILKQCKLSRIGKRVLITYLILISIISDIDTLLFITVPIFSYISLTNNR